jgi:hypothetical protein
VQQSPDELRVHLADQLDFLRASSAAYDAGNEREAKRLAATIRLLVYDTNGSQSLLSQLGLKTLAFIDAGAIPDPKNLLTTAGLTVMEVNANGARHVPAFSAGAPSTQRPRSVPFVEWWTRAVLVDNERVGISRRDLIVAMANTDGGAHVDPSIDRTYARLSRQNSAGWVYRGPGGERPILGIEFASVRQIGWEVEETLRLRRPAPIMAELLEGVGRNDPCPCGGGAKFKRCHGRAV